jgi:hypothetical protein
MNRKVLISRVERHDHRVAISGLILVVVTLLLLASPARAEPEGAAPERAVPEAAAPEKAAAESSAPLVLALAPDAQPGTADPDLDFDIPATPAPPQAISTDNSRLSLRRGMLLGHQALGFGLLAVNLAATVVGQLNYNDKFVTGAPTGRYESAHRMLAWATVGTFATTGALAVFAPAPPNRVSQGFDRISLHKLCMASATAAMVAQAGLGMATAGREGRLNQQDLAKAHLAIGYFTLTALAVGFGALAF